MNSTTLKYSTAGLLGLAILACSGQQGSDATMSSPAIEAAIAADSAERLARSGQTKLYWGDTHLHTKMSADAYANRNTTASPDDSYRFAKGLPVINAYTKARIQIDTPLDFLAVTDHAEYAGLISKLFEGDPQITSTPRGARYLQMIKSGRGTAVFFELIGSVNTSEPFAELNTEAIRKTVWGEMIGAAERHNDPGNFTSLIGWEWSSIPNGANLHRVVFMPQGGDVAEQFTPYSAFESDRPEDLWAWLEETSERTGADFVAIPHNSNISAGKMFMDVDSDGRPITAEHARTRMRWEPAVETTQIKGDSETHPLLSPNDEFADFETYEHLIYTGEDEPPPAADRSNYVRGGLLRGLEIEAKVGANPYKYGLIGATDSHSGYSTAEERNFQGKFSLDSTPENKGIEAVPGAVGWDMSASGLAGVWATENTRQGIVEAFKRKEVYGSSGPRISLRVFGGFEFTSSDADARDFAEVGYSKGVPMGSDLTAVPDGKAPSFLIRAVKDPKDANLDRVQIVKGWLGPDGTAQEKVYDVAWSGDRQLGADGKLPAIGSTVDLETAGYTNTIGGPELSTAWTDPDFDASQRAFYYVRVLQIPTPRNSLYDSVALQQDPPEGLRSEPGPNVSARSVNRSCSASGRGRKIQTPARIKIRTAVAITGQTRRGSESARVCSSAALPTASGEL